MVSVLTTERIKILTCFREARRRNGCPRFNESIKKKEPLESARKWILWIPPAVRQRHAAKFLRGFNVHH